MAALAVVLTSPALAQRNVTLRLNTATLPDTLQPSLFVPDPATIQVRGNVADDDDPDVLPSGETIAWDDRTTLTADHDGGDYWTVDFQIPDNETLNFKFYSVQSEGPDLAWEDGSNHEIAAGTGDVTLDLHYFEKIAGDQPYDWHPFSAEGDSVAVWFRVYMNTLSANEKGYDANDEALRIGVRGNFETLGAEDADGDVTDWGSGGDADVGVRLTRESSDATKPGYHLFSGVAKYPASAAGQAAQYKFFFTDSNTSGNGGYEDGDNRTFTVPAAGTDTTLHWVYYSRSEPLQGTLVNSNVTFSVDVQPLTQIGLFSTTDDVVQVRGGFNGWDCPEANSDDCLLTLQPFSSTYAREIPIRSQPGATQAFKYFLDFDPDYTDAAGAALPDFGYEEPLDYGGGNRPFVFAGTEQQDNGVQFFNSIRPNNVIADGQSIDVTFTVDMQPATEFTVDPFNPTTDTVSVQFEDNIWLLTQGYEPNNTTDLISTGSGGSAIRGFKLTDPDGDLVYMGTLTVEGPTYNGIGYRYFYAGGEDGLVVEGQGGFDEGRRRYRYITDRTAATFSFARDVFKPTSGPVPWEVNPTSGFSPDNFENAIAVGEADMATANEQGPGRSGALALGAAFPNPTSGLAQIRVSAELDDAVTVRVYDVTGRVVATLAEGLYARGERTLDVDTRGWAAGVYVVRAQAGGDVATRRITVVR